MLRHGMCTLDCFDICSFACEVEDQDIRSITGWKGHPLTKGFICPKGRAHVERLKDPNRLTQPLLKVGEAFEAISWDAALRLISEQLKDTLDTTGPQGIVHYYEAGYSGITKHIDELFFNALGGAVKPDGGLCWSGGIKAQKLDFGDVLCHAPEDLINSKLILLWGRNPKVTNIHLVPYILEAKQHGARVVVIDPIQTESADLADQYIQIRPGSDAALAFGMTRVLLDHGLIDEEALQAHTIGWEAYKNQLEGYDLETTASLTGIGAQVIEALALAYGCGDPAAIYLGYGPQRYLGGVSTVRAVDALGMAAGQVGRIGGGVNYANRVFSDAYGDLNREFEACITHDQTFPKAAFGHYLCEHPTRFLWISKGNPVVMMPNANAVIEGIQKATFSVVVDHFMTDTAKYATLVLPDTMLFETEDIVYSSMFSSFIGYSEKMVEPPEGLMGEYDLFTTLADRLGLEAFPKKDDLSGYFKAQLKTVFDTWGFDLEGLKAAKYIDGRRVAIPWQDLCFKTPSGLFEFYSETAKNLGETAMAQHIERKATPEFPLRLLTPHVKQSTSSQHLKDKDALTVIKLHPTTAEGLGLVDGDLALVASRYGSLELPIALTTTVPEGVAVSHAGNREAFGLINKLCTDERTEFGVQAAYYDTFVTIAPMK